MPTNKKVLMVGFGTMGKIHAQKIKDLNPTLLAVVDLRADRLQEARAAGYLAYPNLETAYAVHKNFEIAVVATNTAEHTTNIEQIIEQSLKSGISLPDLFVEKPIIANQDQIQQLTESLLKHGYDSNQRLMTGYLLRESPAVQRFLEKISADAATIVSIDITWQKQRKADRASAGVIKDEATHSLDLIDYILRKLGIACVVRDITINGAIRSRDIVNQQEQDLLYPDPEDPNLNPFAQLQYELHMGNVAVKGFSSFMVGPQQRSMVFNCKIGDSTREYKLVFDDKGHDCCDDERFLTDKISTMWQSFLAAIQSKDKPSHMASMHEAFRDVVLTAELERLAYQWTPQPAPQLHAWLAHTGKTNTSTTLPKAAPGAAPSFNFN